MDRKVILHAGKRELWKTVAIVYEGSFSTVLESDEKKRENIFEWKLIFRNTALFPTGTKLSTSIRKGFRSFRGLELQAV